MNTLTRAFCSGPRPSIRRWILKPLRGEAAREAQRLRARAQCVLTALSYRRTRFRPQPTLWKNPVFSGLVCRSALKDHIFDTLWPEHCQQRRSRVFCTSSAVLAPATTGRRTAQRSNQKNGATLGACCPCIGSGTPYAGSRSPGTGFCWQLQPGTLPHVLANLASCHGLLCQHLNSQPRDLNATWRSPIEQTRFQSMAIRAQRSQISVQRDLSARLLLRRGRIRSSKWENGSSKCSLRLSFKHKLSPPTIGVAPDRDLQAQTQVAGPPASAPENTNRLVIRHAPLVLYPWMRVAHFCHLQKPRRSLVHVNLALRCGVMSVDFCSFADSESLGGNSSMC